MAKIIPFRGWRYHERFYDKIETMVSPLFDVVSESQRQKLYGNPYNSIHISVPKGNDPAQSANHTLNQWKNDEIIVRDKLPGIYVYYQYFRLPGDPNEYCRKGFISNIRIYDWDEQVILRHENTMPNSVNDRIAILEQTQMNVSPTHGLYHDPDFTIATLLDESQLNPIVETEDYQGVRDVLSVITDPEKIKTIQSLIADKQIILADGHHRYAGSLAYMKQQRKLNANHTGNEGYNYHMMYLTNMDANDIRVLPTHRLIAGLADFKPDQIIENLEQYFKVTQVDNVHDINEIIISKSKTFGIIIKDKAFKINLKPGLEQKISWHFPDKIKALDLTILHYYVIEKVLGIAGKDQRKSPNIQFDRNFADCLLKVYSGQSQMALIVNELTIDKIKDVCFSGYTLPQKSTYFYPKVICGFIFDSIANDEFE